MVRSFLIVSLLIISGCSIAPCFGKEPRPWHKVTSWGYQLQHPKPHQIAASPFDLVVIDYSRDGCNYGRFTRKEVEKMKTKADGGRRLVVAYMSIGEAEPYRFYWKKGWKPGKPNWLLTPNPRWPDNYRVKFWNPEWQEIIYGREGSYLDQIIDAGFDGAYLDIVDGYEAFMKKRPKAKKEMKNFIRDLAAYARMVKGDTDFGIFPQNAPELLKDKKYLNLITGLGKEEVYFFDTDDKTEEEDREWDEGLLDKVKNAGKLVLTVDYAHEEENIKETIKRARKKGYIPYVTDVELDRLNVYDEAKYLSSGK